MSDRFRYVITAAHISAAIDALTIEAVSDATISELDEIEDRDVQLVMAFFNQQDELGGDKGPSKGKRRRDGGPRKG